MFFLCFHETTTNHAKMFNRSYLNVFENDDSTRIVGMRSLCVIKDSTFDGEEHYMVRFLLDDDSTSFCIDIEEYYLPSLNQFLDSCSAHQLIFEHELCYEIDRKIFFTKGSFYFVAYNQKRDLNVDIRVSPQKLKSIIEKAERIIAEEKKKDK